VPVGGAIRWDAADCPSDGAILRPETDGEPPPSRARGRLYPSTQIPESLPQIPKRTEGCGP
jgi:hypothetical protein